MLATYAAVFDQVHLIRVPQRSQHILVAGPAARPLDRPALVSAAQALADRVDLGFDLTRLVETGYETAPRVDAPVLEDVQRSALRMAGLINVPGRESLRSRAAARLRRGSIPRR
jgi:hypothetical protein